MGQRRKRKSREGKHQSAHENFMGQANENALYSGWVREPQNGFTLDVGVIDPDCVGLLFLGRSLPQSLFNIPGITWKKTDLPSFGSNRSPFPDEDSCLLFFF